MSLFRDFVNFNAAVCDRIERILPARFTRSLLNAFRLSCREILVRKGDQVAIDIGGGHSCPYAIDMQSSTLIGCDILYEQIAANRDVHMGFVADVSTSIPLADNTVDLLTTRSVMEHLRRNEAFISESARVLRPGGISAHVFPCRFAPFALINRALPHRLSSWLIKTVFPQWRDECGFFAFYNNCYYSRIRDIFEGCGLEIAAIEFRYYQSIYFKFFVPLYLVSLVYDLVIWSLGIRNLACQIFIVARKPGGDCSPQ